MDKSPDGNWGSLVDNGTRMNGIVGYVNQTVSSIFCWAHFVCWLSELPMHLNDILNIFINSFFLRVFASLCRKDCSSIIIHAVHNPYKTVMYMWVTVHFWIGSLIFCVQMYDIGSASLTVNEERSRFIDYPTSVKYDHCTIMLYRPSPSQLQQALLFIKPFKKEVSKRQVHTYIK